MLLEVNNLTGERFTNVSFKLKKGEILGFSGLVGAGRSEVMQAIFGYLPVYKGSVKLDGADWKLGDTTIRLRMDLFIFQRNGKSREFASAFY